MTSERRKAIFNWCGGSLGLAGIYWFARKLQAQGGLGVIEGSVHIWMFPFCLCILCQIVANGLLGLAWWRLLLAERQELSALAACSIYGLSLLAKYVPGNIFQFCSRHMLGVASGLNGRALLKTVFWELSGLVTAGIVLGAFALPLVYPVSTLFSFFGVATLLAAATFLLRKWKPQLVSAFGLYLVFLILGGSSFAYLLHSWQTVETRTFTDGPLFLGAYVVAWLCGLMIPGAPAGIGIREAVLLGLLSTSSGGSSVFAAIFLSRLACCAGDLVYFLFMLCIRFIRTQAHAS